MRPKQVLFDGKVTLIRPLAYEREDVIAKLAKAKGFTNLCRYRCPHSLDTKRAAMKRLLSKLEKENPTIKINIFKSLENIKEDYLLDHPA